MGTIYYIKSHFRGMRRPQQRPRLSHPVIERRSGTFILGAILAIFVFTAVGAWLMISVALVGRSNNDCLQSGRRVCGIFHHG